MPELNIQGTLIDFPDSGESPNWAQGVIEFAQAVEIALQGLTGAADISPQFYNIDLFNGNTTPQSIQNLQFSTATVRVGYINYAVTRTTDSETAIEAGTMTVVYNPSKPVNQKWELMREFEGDGKIDFSITDTGQLQFTTHSSVGPLGSPLAGSNYTGKIHFSAKALLQN